MAPHPRDFPFGRFCFALGIMLVLLNGWIPAFGADADTQVKRARKSVGDFCRSKVQRLASKGCLFTVAQVLKTGQRFSFADRVLDKYEKIYAFVPPLPHTITDATWAAACRNPAFKKKKHRASADRGALEAFFQKELDDLLFTYYQRLADIARTTKCNPEVAGREILSVLAFLEKMRWAGRVPRRDVEVGRSSHAAEKILKDLGYEKRPVSPGSTIERWLSPEGLRRDRAFKAFLHKHDEIVEKKWAALDKKIQTEPVEEKSPFETALGIKLNKWRSPHFQVEAKLNELEIRDCLVAQEAGYRAFLELLGIKDPGRYAVPIKSVLLGSRDLYAKYVESMSGLSKERQKFTIERTGSTRNFRLGYWVSKSGAYSPRLRDNLVVYTNIFVRKRFGFSKLPLWIRQGFLPLLSLQTLGSADSGWVSAKESTGKQEGSYWFDYYDWLKDLRAVEAKGLAPSMRAVLSRSNTNELVRIQIAKMYCVVRFLLEVERGRFVRLLRALSPHGWKPNEEGEYAALKAVGWTVADLEKAYGAWMGK